MASSLFAIAIPLSDAEQEVLNEMQDKLGLSGSVKRAGAGRWIPASHVAHVEKWLHSLECGKSDGHDIRAETCAAADSSGYSAMDRGEEDSLIDELLTSNPSFQALVAKSKAGSRKPFLGN